MNITLFNIRFMKISNFNKGVITTSLGSFWWGILGVFYFKYFSFVGNIELVIHRSIWTAVVLVLTTFILKKWKLFFKAFTNLKEILILLITGILIFTNWAVWLHRQPGTLHYAYVF